MIYDDHDSALGSFILDALVVFLCFRVAQAAIPRIAFSQADKTRGVAGRVSTVTRLYKHSKGPWLCMLLESSPC